MNKLPATIKSIQQSGTILLVDAAVDDQVFSVLMIESLVRPEWLEVGAPVDLVFKETEVSLGKDLKGLITTRNRMPCTVMELDEGELLCKIGLQFRQFTISSVVTTRAVRALKIVPGDVLDALVKANEVSLVKQR